jgi:NAD(P)-dependent dehydrogenase (short-subunit alcohol dehydrogenase family)
MNIQDSTVLVTGANRGIGKAFADALLDRGATKVYAAVRDVATVTDPHLVPIQLDVTDPDRVAAVAYELDDVQVVVNNAGVLQVGAPLSASLDAARVELETNYLSLVSITQAFAPVLERNGGGAFINVLSVFSWVATPLITRMQPRDPLDHAPDPARIQVPPRLTRRSLIFRPRAPQPEHSGCLRRSATVTIIARSPNSTSRTHAPASPSIRLYAVVTRTSPSS